MSQNNFVIDNGTGLAVRQDIENALQSLAGLSSGSSNPSTTYAFQLFANTSTNKIRLRNAANDDFIDLFTTSGGLAIVADSTFTADVTFDGATAGRDIVFDRSANSLEFADNAFARFGDGADFNIHHDGSDNYLDSANGNIIFRSTGNDNQIFMTPNGAVELYHDGEKKLNTNSNGVRFIGNLEGVDNEKIRLGNSEDIQIFHESSSNDNVIDCATTRPLRIRMGGSNQFEFLSGGGIKMNDGRKIILGDSSDLQIYHDGSNSFVLNTGGQLLIRSSTALQLGAPSGEIYLAGVENGAVELYHDNSKKLETTSVGISSLDTLITHGVIRPASDNDHAIGTSIRRYTEIFAVNGSINTSDKTEKNNIVESDLGLNFINKLKPVSYKWNKDDGKTHYGLIAQDIEETIANLGKTVADFGAISKEKDSPMGLNYSQIISPLIKAVQELSSKVAALEAA